MVAIILTRSLPMPKRLPVLILALVHGLAGLLITLSCRPSWYCAGKCRLALLWLGLVGR
jgi:hypothetical protein